MNQNQPTRQPPTEPGDYRQSLIDLRDGLERETKRLDELIASLAPFAPQLPVVELWEGEQGGVTVQIVASNGSYIATVKDKYHGSGAWNPPMRQYTNLRRTHVCKWEACDE